MLMNTAMAMYADEVERQTALALDKGMAGVCCFDLDETFASEIMPWLGKVFLSPQPSR